MAKSRRRSREQWAELINEMDESGMAQSAWCKERGINYRSMQSMKATLKAADGQTSCQEDRSVPEKAPTGFIRVIAKAQEPKAEIVAPGIEFYFGAMVVTVRMEQ